MTDSPFLRLDGLSKRFGDLQVLDRIDLAVATGEVMALLGPSGSGKTTLLRSLAGFETPDAGRVVVDGRDVTGLAPAERGVGMVFQHYALFPHLSVAGNVSFGLEGGGGLDRDARRRRVAEVLALVDLAGFEERRIDELSGGQQQRVALARALAPDPRLLLLDEPLSNLDPALRERTRRELLRLVREVGITTVLVTHEQEEAFDLGDRVAVLHAGSLQQVGAPEELYLEPANRFVAGFIGRSSTLPGQVDLADGAGGCWVRLGGSDGPVWPAVERQGLTQGEAVELLVRPESLDLSRDLSAPEALTGRVTARRYGGPLTWYTVDVSSGFDADTAGEVGTTIEVEVLAGASVAREGDAVRVIPRPDIPRSGTEPPADAPPSPRAFRPPGEDRDTGDERPDRAGAHR